MDVSDDEALGQRGGRSRRWLWDPQSAHPSLGWTTGHVSELLPPVQQEEMWTGLITRVLVHLLWAGRGAGQ